MTRILFFFFCMIFFVTAKGQSSYAEAMQQGDAAFKIGDYTTAYKKYFAAEAFDPTKKDIVKQNVTKVFDAIEALRKKAEDALAEAKKQTNLAIEAKKEAEKEKQNALSSSAEAQKQQALAEKSLNIIKEFLKKDVGKKYQGGIIFYSDSTREHGLIAAEKDFDSTYTWEEAKKKCEDYSVTVDSVIYDDWFLPSKDTLALLCINKSAIGGFSRDYYWSSSEFSGDRAWSLYFYGGDQAIGPQVSRNRVRAVRAF